MQHEPCAFLCHSQSAMEFVATDSVFAVHYKPDSREPLFKGNRRILKHCPYLEREFLLGVISIAAVQAGLCQICYFVGIAARAADNFIQPANGDHELAAVLVIAEVLDCRLKCLGCFHAPRLQEKS